MKEWYGGCNKYDLKRGDVWQIDGKHRIMCGDNTVDDLSILFDGVEIDCVYTDPPWNSNIATKFYKHAGIDTVIDINLMIPKIVSKLKDNFFNSYLVVEFGNPCFELLKKSLIENGAVESKIFESYYGNNTPYSIWVGSFKTNVSYPNVIDTSKGKLFTKCYIKWFVDNGMKTFCDPFVGLGEFYRVAVNNGLICYGIELNPNKLAKILEWAEKKKYIINKIN